MGLCLLNSFLRSKKPVFLVLFSTILLLFTGIRSVRAQAPTVTSFSPTTVCQGENVTITGAGFTGATNVKLGSLNAAGFTVVDDATITATVDVAAVTGPVTVTLPTGTGASSADLTIKPAPTPVLTDAVATDPFTNCNGNAVYQLKVNNNSINAPPGSAFKIDWGDGSTFTQTDWASGAQTAHTYNAQGYFAIVFTITPPNGCTKSITYQFYNGQNPLASFTTSASTVGLCVPAAIQFKIGDWFNNSAGTTYQVIFGDGSPNVTLSNPLNATNTVQLLSHTYVTSSCPNIDFTATLKAINGCFTTTYTLNQIVIRKKPIADFTTLPNPACITSPVCFTNTTTNGSSGASSCVTTTNFTWDFGDGATSTSANPGCHTYALPGTYNVTITASNATCGSDIRTKPVVVLPTSPAPVVASPVVYCRSQSSSPLTATGTGLLWYTAATGGVGNTNAPTPSTANAGNFTWFVSQTLANSCESPRVPIVVTVNAPPPAPTVATPVQLCQNQAAVPLTATGTGLLWYTTATGGTGSSTAPTPQTATTGSTTYYVSQTTNTCEGPRAAIAVTVNSLAVAPVVTTPVIYCQNQAAVPLKATGAGLLWYTTETGGTGSSAAPTPSTATPGTTLYYVSQVTGCGEGPRSTITVTVNASPSATIAYTPILLCNVINTPATPNLPVAVTLTGTGGGSFSVSPAGLSVNAITGEINPSGAVANVYTITYALTGTGGCSNFITTAKVTVTGSPTATISYPSICTSDPIVNVRLNGTAGGSFASTAGLTLDAATGAITPASSTPGTYTVTYTIAASPPCPGYTTMASFTVTKAPSAAINYSITNLCNVLNTGTTPNLPVDVTQTGDAGGVYSISPTAGLPIDAATGQINPSGAATGTYMITYRVAGAGGCANFSTTATVSVSGAPTASVSYPSPVCASDASAVAQITGTRGGTFSSTPGLIIDPATGIISPSASSSGTYTVTYTIAATGPCPGFVTTANIVLTPAPAASISYSPANLCNVANTPTTPNPIINVTQAGTGGGRYSVSPTTGLTVDLVTGAINPAGAIAGPYIIKYTVTGSGGCADYSVTTNVTVSGAPTAGIGYTSPVCTSTPSAAVQLTGVTGGTFSSTAGLTINAATGAVTPGTSTPGNYVITYTIAPSAPCPGFVTTTNIAITQAPAATIVYTPASLCNVANTAQTPNTSVNVIRTGTAGGTYSISPAAGLLIDALTGMLTPSSATPGPYTITYSIPAAGGCPNFSTTTNVTVSAAPTAAIVYRGSPYCRGITTPQPVAATGNAGGVYSAGAGLAISATTGDINPAQSQPGVYTVTYTIAASSPCPGYVATTTVQIDDSPVLTFPAPVQSICSGGTAVYPPTSTVANTTYTWAVVGTLPANVSGISSGTASGANPVISLSFTNTGTLSQVLTIQVKPTNPSQNPCPGTPYNLTLNVNPIPAVLSTDTFHFCMGTPATALTAKPSAGNTVKWYDQNLVLLGGAPLVSTAVPAQFIYYTSQSNSFGCESPKARIVVYVHPTAKIVSSTFTHPTTCGIPSGSIVLNVLDLNNNPIPNIPLSVHYDKFQTSYQVQASTDAAGKIAVPLVAGTYSNIYVETFGCLSQKIPNVFILKDPNPPAQPVAGYNPPICSETPLNLTALTPTSTQLGPISYVWAGPAFGPLADTTSNTVVSFPSANASYAGTYVVYAIQNNCISPTTDFQVVIKQSPTKPIISTRAPLCVGDDLVLQAYSSIPIPNASLTYQWTGPGSGFPVNTPNAGISKVKIQDAGIYTITVNSPQTGCSSATDTLILIGDYPVVKFAKDTLTLPTGYLLNLEPIITNAAVPGILPIKKYEWTPFQDIACNDAACSSPVATVKNSMCYNVKATNIYGCSGSAVVCVKVFCQNSQVFIPNAFAPMGNVPENSKLMVRASGISSVKSFRVFNRWGRILFEKNNFPPNSTDFGWDGRVNGKLADPGVYIYTVEVVCENGIPYSYKGNVTLL